MPLIKYLSYINDISIIVTLTSFYRNIRVLERKVERLIMFGRQSAILFDIAKTELIYFTTSKAAKKYSLSLPDNIIIQLKALIK